MEIYLIKVNLSLILFYLCYKLLFQRDTFWMLRRVYLLVSVLFSFVYPLISVEGWIRKQEPIMTAIASIQLDEFVITPNEAAQSSLFTLENVLWGIFGMIAVLMLARMILQLISILRKRSRGTKSELQGVPIIRMYDKLMPFSFFQWIFINPLLHTHSEAEEILEHEQTHVRQWHSMDVIIGQVQTMLCWFNPAAWLMEREIRINLEFLADNQVVRSGFEPKKYQYHLLSLTYEPADSKLGNQFNVSPIKKRIKMMNSKKTRKTGLLKYALIIPIALVMLYFSTFQDMIASEVSKNITDKFNTEVAANPDLMQENIIQDNQSNTRSEQVFDVVDEQPIFPGGQNALFKFLGENIKYPFDAIEKKIEGRVIAQFIIDKEGKVSGVKIMRSVHPSLDAEAKRVIETMPNWTPGKNKGKAVNVRYTLPVVFKMTSDESKSEVDNVEQNTFTVPQFATMSKSEADNEEQETQSPQTENNKVYDVVDTPPVFPGGEKALYDWLAKTIIYPVIAQEVGAMGRISVGYVIDENGNISDAKILNTKFTSPEPGLVVVGYGKGGKKDGKQKEVTAEDIKAGEKALEKEALRVIQAMPKWTPGKDKGKNVKVNYVMPIQFKLQ